VPNAVGFANGNVIHLHRNVMVEAVMPGVGVSVFGDGEGRSTLAGVLDYVEAGVMGPSKTCLYDPSSIRRSTLAVFGPSYFGSSSSTATLENPGA
jgi:hypothetical protein